MSLKSDCCYITFAISLFFSSLVSAQSKQDDSSFTSTAVNNAIEAYHQIVQKATGLYNGPEYDNYYFGFQEGSPYFGVKDSVAGSILYDSVLYHDIFMKYDEVKDVVAIWNNNDAIQLLNEKVSRFTFQDHSFTRLIKDDHAKNLVSTGFYQELYTGKIAVFKKVVKIIMEKPDMSEGILRSIEQKTYYYLRYAGEYTEINNKGDLIDALKDHKNEIKEFIGSKKLNFKKDPLGFLIQVAAYYDTL